VEDCMQFKKTTIAFSAVVGIGIMGSVASVYGKINFVSWGGAYTASQMQACIEPYQAKTGQEFNVIDYNGGLAEIKTQVEAGNIQWDIIDQTPEDAMRGCDEGLFLKLDHSILEPAPDGTPATEDFLDGALGDCYVGNISWATVPAFDASRIKGDEKPSTIADFWDLEKYPGRRGLRKVPRVNLEWALLSDGVAREDVYATLSTKEGQDRAFAKLDEIKEHVVWWEAGAQAPQMLADHEVVMTTAYNGHLYNAMHKEGKDFEIMWGPQVFDIDTYVVVKGAPNEKAALDFLKFCTSAEALADITNYISYGPLRKSSAAFVNADILPHLPTAPENFKTALIYDTDFWADNVDTLTERFNSWLAQ